MKPIYTHCPHCEYPVVVSMHEAPFRRHCRQCSQTYTPADVFRTIATESNQESQKDQRATFRRCIKKMLQNRMVK